MLYPKKLYKNQAGQANPADNTTPPAGDANGADGQVYDADFKDVDSDKKKTVKTNNHIESPLIIKT